MGCEKRGESHSSPFQVVPVTAASGHEVSLFTFVSLIGNKNLSWKPTADFPSSPVGCRWSGHVVGTREARKPNTCSLPGLIVGGGLGQQDRGVRASGRWLGLLCGVCWAGHPFSFFLK